VCETVRKKFFLTSKCFFSDVVLVVMMLFLYVAFDLDYILVTIFVEFCNCFSRDRDANRNDWNGISTVR